jgi:hypothetical protein
MLLRSGKIAINDEIQTGREPQTEMANMNPPETQNSQNPSTSSIVPPSSSMGANTNTMHASEIVSSMVCLILMHSISHSEPILTYVGPRGPPHTPSPIRDILSRLLVPPGFSISFSGREQTYGMPTSMMANLQNVGSTFSEPTTNINSPVQGSGINVGRTNQASGLRHPVQLSTLTNNFTAAWRQQMDESNHEMVQMLTQTLATVLNPLIQNTTQSNQQMKTQVARMSEFLGIPQHQRPLPKD